MKTAAEYKKEIIDSLKKAPANNLETYITMENGDELLIIPEGYGEIYDYIQQDKFDMIDYWLVEGGQLPYLGESKLDKLCDNLANYTNLVYDNEREKLDCKKYYDEHHNDPDFDWGYYSDWHKDLFGYRPGKEFGKSRHEPINFIITFTFDDKINETFENLANWCIINKSLQEIFNYDELEYPRGYVMNLQTTIKDTDCVIKGTLADGMLLGYLEQLETATILMRSFNIKKIRVIGE